jgi:hypothetical protein
MTIVINASGKKDCDIRRMKQVFGILHTSPGEDKFTFVCQENGKEVELDFPNHYIHITPDLIQRVHQIVGDENVRIEE